jgi:hypothetical protein
MGTIPGLEAAGETATMAVADWMTKLRARTVPNSTSVTRSSPAPRMVTIVPPDVGP